MQQFYAKMGDFPSRRRFADVWQNAVATREGDDAATITGEADVRE